MALEAPRRGRDGDAKKGTSAAAAAAAAAYAASDDPLVVDLLTDSEGEGGPAAPPTKRFKGAAERAAEAKAAAREGGGPLYTIYWHRCGQRGVVCCLGAAPRGCCAVLLSVWVQCSAVRHIDCCPCALPHHLLFSVLHTHTHTHSPFNPP